MKLKHLVFPLIVFLAATIPVLADSTYTNEASFLAAAGGGVVTQNFSGIAAPGSFVSYGMGGSVTLGAVTYSSNAPSTLYIVDAAYDPGFYGFMGAVASLSADYGTFNLASSAIGGGAEAIGFTYNTIGGSSPVTISLSNGDVFTFADPGNAGAFFGIITSSPVSSISLGDSGTGVDIGRFEYSAVTAPEPASLMLLSAGLMGLAALRRKVSV